MRVNTSMTLYHKIRDVKSKTYKWERHLISYVNWQEERIATTSEGYDNANSLLVFVPKLQNNLNNIKFDIGDIVVKGIVYRNIEKQEDLKGHVFYNLTSVIDNDQGTSQIQHIELVGK